MADTKFSQFQNGADVTQSDQVVGLRAGVNTRFTNVLSTSEADSTYLNKDNKADKTDVNVGTNDDKYVTCKAISESDVEFKQDVDDKLLDYLKISDAASTYQNLSEKDQPNGYPGLDSNSKILESQLPGTGYPVTSVFGRSGTVIPQANDYTFSQIGSTPTTVSGYGITDALSTSVAASTYLTQSNAASTYLTQSNASSTYQALSLKNQANGYAGLDASSKILASQLPGTGYPVSSIFGRSGVVIAEANDYTFAQIGSKPTTLSGYGITDGALDSAVVHNTGNENIAGIKNFTSFPKTPITNVIYVSSSGSNSDNNGSCASPYQTLDFTLSQITTASASNPFCIFVSPGTYTITGNLALKPNVSIIGNGAIVVVTGNVTIDPSFLSVDSNSFNKDIIWSISGSINIDFSTKPGSAKTNLEFIDNGCLESSSLTGSIIGSYKEYVGFKQCFWNKSPILTTQIINITVRNLYSVFLNNKIGSITSENTGSSFNRLEVRGGLSTGPVTVKSTSTGFQFAMIRGVGNLTLVMDGSSVGCNVDYYETLSLLNFATLPTVISLLSSSKALFSDINTGTDNTKYITALALAGSRYFQPVSVSVNRTGATTTYGPGSPVLNNIVSDTLSTYNTTTGTFTAPSAGVYKCDYCLHFTVTTTANNQTARIDTTGYKNGILSADLYTVDAQPVSSTGSVVSYTVTNTFSFPLTTGQTIAASCANNGTTPEMTLVSGFMTITKISN